VVKASREFQISQNPLGLSVTSIATMLLPSERIVISPDESFRMADDLAGRHTSSSRSRLPLNRRSISPGTAVNRPFSAGIIFAASWNSSASTGRRQAITNASRPTAFS